MSARARVRARASVRARAKVGRRSKRLKKGVGGEERQGLGGLRPLLAVQTKENRREGWERCYYGSRREKGERASCWP